MVILLRAKNTESIKQENPALYETVVQVCNNKDILDASPGLADNAEFAEVYERYEITMCWFHIIACSYLSYFLYCYRNIF